MEASRGGSRSSRARGGTRRKSSSKRSGSSGRSSSAASRSTAAKKAATTRRANARKRSTAAKKAASTRKAKAASRSDKSVEQFRAALERSVTISRERLDAAVDDAVKRGRMTRKDANELISTLVSRGKKHRDGLVRDLEKVQKMARREIDDRVKEARREIETRVKPARRAATDAAGKASRAARDLADQPLAGADRVRRRAGGPGFPITGYDQLTAAQVKKRLTKLNKAELRKVRTREKNGAARKSILSDVEKRLG